MLENNKLCGIIPAVVTPIKENGQLDFNLMEKQVKYLVGAGVQGLFVCGGTGEGAYLKTDEKKEVFQAVREMAGDQVFLCAALINSNTKAVLSEISQMGDFRPDYLVSTPPYYHAASQNDIYAHYELIAKESPAPMIIYNIPSTTYNYIELGTIKALAELDHIAGVKDSSGNFMNFSRGLFERAQKDFVWIQGEDYLCGASFLIGADGVVSGLSNVRVEPYIEMYQAYLAGDYEKIKECQVRINRLYQLVQLYGNGNAAIKAATEMYGRGSRWMQQKSMSLDDKQMKKVAEVLDAYEKE
ncbi:dihydrodipicolinate synthase family protein [Faecalicatena contorta]|uniref:dihydrodipicolinate synthase family protein n=1 Tax=Faecalicatena contorta TaxID=39482 RepID=UPI00129EABD9|nr:dihydrodipicolinate synthase family protein [Faecalicatena contorta]MRM89894.1 dihydrodipicolinate synthase family protein [Faecalicatena contorta]